MNFLNALERTPKLIEKYEIENNRLSKDLPILKEVIDSVFKKDPELKVLKTELMTLDRQILQTLKAKDEPIQNAQAAETASNTSISNDTIRSGQPMSIKEIIDANRDRILMGRTVDRETKQQSGEDQIYKGMRR